MLNEQARHLAHDHTHGCCKRSISWTAIVIGSLVGMGIAFLLNIFGLAINLYIFSMNEQGDATFALGGLIAVIISVIVAMYLAGWVSGYLGRSYSPKRNLGILYGFVTWVLVLLLTTLFANKLAEHTIAYSNFLTSPSSIKISQEEEQTVVKTKLGNRTIKAAVPTEDVTTGFSIGAFIMFALFYIGAFASCVGGYYGMEYRDDLD